MRVSNCTQAVKACYSWRIWLQPVPPSRESTNCQLLLCSVNAVGGAAREPGIPLCRCVDNVRAVRHRDSGIIVLLVVEDRRGRGRARPREMGPSQNVFI